MLKLDPFMPFFTFIRIISVIIVFSLVGFIKANGQPVVSDFSPKSAHAGSNLVISGSGFSNLVNENKVKIGASEAQVIAASTTSLTVKVPSGCQFGPVSVTTGNLNGLSNLSFVNTYPGNVNTLHSSQYEPEKQWALNSNTESVIAADLTGDNIPEIILTGSEIGGILIFGNLSTQGNLQLQAPKQISTGVVPRDVTAADFNGDGWLDIVVCHEYGNQIAILINKGTGTIDFNDPIKLPCGKFPRSLTTADFNLDGKTDIVVANSDSYTIGVYLNTTISEVSFGLPLVLATQSTPRSVITGDIDGDGKADIAVSNGWGHTVSIFRNNSSLSAISFITPLHIATGLQPREVRLADIDQDGKLDLMNTNSEDRNLSLFINISQPGQIAFRPVIKVPVGWDAAHLEIADINGDGNVEVHATSLSDRTIYSYKVNGSGGSTSLTNYFSFRPGSSAPDSIARQVKCFGFADLDTDGKPDLFSISGQAKYLTISRNRANEPLVLGFFPNFGASGTKVNIKGARFSAITELKFGSGNAESYSVVSDSAIEAIVGESGTGKVIAKNSNGFAWLDSFIYRPVIDSFSPREAYPGQEISIYGKGFGSDNSSNKVWLGSLQGEIISSSPNLVKVLAPQGGIHGPVSLLSGGSIAISGWDFFSKVALPEASFNPQSFVDTTIDDPGIRPKELLVGDLNNDGKLDWVIANSATSNGITFFQNTSTKGSLKWKVLHKFIGTPFSPNVENIALSDLDGDGLIDLGVILEGTNRGIKILKNNSSGDNLDFNQEISLGLPGSSSYKLVFADLTGNGKKDIILYHSGTIYIYQNVSIPGNLIFLPFISFGTGNPYTSRMHIADFDNDGLIDIANYNASTMHILLNKSNQSGLKFSPAQGPFEFLGTPYLLGDLDADKKPDFLTVQPGSNYYFYRNNSTPGMIQFTNEMSFEGPEFSNDYLYPPGLADLNGDGKPDIISAYGKYVIKNISANGSVNFDGLNAGHIDKGMVNGFEFGDIDLDGKTDIIAPYGASKILLSRNAVAENVILKLCPSNDFVDLVADLVGTNYQWQVRVDSNSSFQNISPSPIFGSPNARNFSLSKPPSFFSGYTFRCLVDGVASREFMLRFEVKWNQNVEEQWHSWYWSCPGFPDIYCDVVIETGTVVINFEAKCRTLTIKPGARVELRNGGSLEISK